MYCNLVCTFASQCVAQEILKDAKNVQSSESHQQSPIVISSGQLASNKCHRISQCPPQSHSVPCKVTQQCAAFLVLHKQRFFSFFTNKSVAELVSTIRCTNLNANQILQSWSNLRSSTVWYCAHEHGKHAQAVTSVSMVPMYIVRHSHHRKCTCTILGQSRTCSNMQNRAADENTHILYTALQSPAGATHGHNGLLMANLMVCWRVLENSAAAVLYQAVANNVEVCTLACTLVCHPQSSARRRSTRSSRCLCNV